MYKYSLYLRRRTKKIGNDRTQTLTELEGYFSFVSPLTENGLVAAHERPQES